MHKRKIPSNKRSKREVLTIIITIGNMTNKSIRVCCRDCGVAASNATYMQKFGAKPMNPSFSVSTYCNGTCDCCGKDKAVTEVRDFFYPDFSLIKKKKKKESNTVKLDRLYETLIKNGYEEDVKQVLSQKHCDIDETFLGFTDIYKNLSKIIPKDKIVIDFGPAYGFQSYYFKDHKEYIGVEIDKEIKQFEEVDNASFLFKDGKEYIEELMGFEFLNNDKFFAICSYCPDMILRENVRRNFNNCFVYYPSN